MWTDAARERYKDDGRRYPSDLTDAEWQTIEPVLRSYATLTVDLREMVKRLPVSGEGGVSVALLAQGVRFLADRADLARPLPGGRPRRRARHGTDIAGLLTRAVRDRRGREPEPTTAILDSQSVSSGPQTGPRGTDGNKKVRGIKRHVLTCSLGVARTALRGWQPWSR